jgi:lysozyme
LSRFEATLLQRALAAVGMAQPAPASDPAVAADPRDQAVQVAAALCRRFEGFYARPYLCPAGVPTIGFGATYYLDGRPVKLTDEPITRDGAEQLLLAMVRRTYLPAVLQLCPAVDDPNRLAALVDFAFNLGSGNLRASTLRRKVNTGDWAGVPAELRKWVRGGGRVLPGLVLRREAEVALV